MDTPKLNIMVVDDSINIVDSLIKILKISGYEAETAYNGYDALRKLSLKNYDIVICDIEMPGMGGLELLAHVRREHGEKVAFVLMTGYIDQEYFLKAIQLGASDFINKPVDANQILHCLQVQKEKRRDLWDYNEVCRLTDYTEVKVTITPEIFQQIDFIKVYSKYFKDNLDLPNTCLNELLLCMEEMLYNAFIHGTLKLHLQERSLGYESYKSIISEKLKIHELSSKRIWLRLFIYPKDKNIIVEVEDEGDGFDHKYWVEKAMNDESIILSDYGRGISILYNLSDKLTFEKNGRLIRIEKSLLNASQRS